jgi:outer membrane protein OmpA-like peptidoglycan-associated protein
MAKQRLDRRAKASVAAAAFLLVAAPVLAVGRYVDTQMHVSNIAEAHGMDDRLVSFGNGTTVLLPHGSVAQRLADWLKLGKQDASVFQIGDGMFKQGSTEFTPNGWNRITAFADLLKAHRDLKGEVIVGTREDPSNAATERLEELRAKRLRDEALGLGLAPDRVAVGTQPVAELMASHKIDRVRGGSQLYVRVSKSSA